MGDAKNTTLRTALGMVSGAAASWMMTKFQSQISSLFFNESEPKSAQPESAPATVNLADRLSERFRGRPVSDQHKSLAGQIAHYGFGTSLGGLYGAASSGFPQIRAGWGSLYGSMIFLGADEIMVPAMKLSPPPTQSPLRIHAYGFAAHLFYGICLESFYRAGSRVGFQESAQAQTASKVEPDLLRTA